MQRDRVIGGGGRPLEKHPAGLYTFFYPSFVPCAKVVSREERLPSGRGGTGGSG